MPIEAGKLAALVTLYRPLRLRLLWAAAALLLVGCTKTNSTKHVVSVTFDYDFTNTTACSQTILMGCIAQFNVYDIGSGKPVKLFSIPAPTGAHSVTRDIVGKSQPIDIGGGKHVLAVSAQMSTGEESNMQECTAGVILP